MKNPQAAPYIILLALIILAACAYFASGISRPPPMEPMAPYPQGYFTRAKTAGPMRVIPLAGNSLKSPPASDPGAVFSPFEEEEKSGSPVLQNSDAY